MKTRFLIIIIATLVGNSLPLQGGVNPQCGKFIHQSIFTAFTCFLVGTIGPVIYLFLLKSDLSSIGQTKSIFTEVVAAVLFVVFYITAIIIVAPKLGMPITFTLVLVGQLAISMLIDHYNLFEPSQHMNWQRLLGLSFLITGVLLIRNF